jgi:hypothetical protein
MLQVFPRIYNPLKDWAMSDEAYVRKLQDEANDLLKRKVQVTEDTRKSMMRADDMKTKVSQGQDINYYDYARTVMIAHTFVPVMGEV